MRNAEDFKSQEDTLLKLHKKQHLNKWHLKQVSHSNVNKVIDKPMEYGAHPSIRVCHSTMNNIK